MERFSRTVEKLYGAAADPLLWPGALHGIEDLTGCIGAVINFIPKGSAPPRTIAGRFTNEQCAEYSRHYQHLCPRIAFGIAHPELPFHCDRMLISETEMDRDPVYHWLGTHGLRYFIAARLPDTELYHIYWSLQRSPQQGHVQREDIELFTLLTPHLVQVITLADQLGTLTAHQQFSSAIMEALPHAVFALGSAGQILFTTTSAERLLIDGDGFETVDGVLTPRHRPQKLAFQTLIESALHPSAGAAGGWMGLERRSGRLPYSVFVAPIVTEDEELMSAKAKVLVVAHDPASRLVASADMLKHLYALTDSEARLARALASGHDVGSASALLRIGTGTARTHLKAVFRKMGINRQQDLVRLLTSAPLVESASQ